MPDPRSHTGSPADSARPDEFFIGWLKMPPGYQRFVRTVVAVLLFLATTMAWILPARQQSPGTAVWESAQTTLEGLVLAEPYPILRVADPASSSGIRSILLVEEGKHGAAARVMPFAGRTVRVTGTFLHRDDRWMLELAPNDSAVQSLDSLTRETRQALAAPKKSALGRVNLQGEIIDPKCYLGAMKPGGGKTHKACAILCISGGIPPMFVTRDEAGHETFYLLTTTAGGPLHDQILPFAGDVVELAGELELDADLNVLRIDVSLVRRL
jgi:hypothetical protein